ncbi:MAG: hypothetical protein WD227_13090 [Vicinamibacterales bacterium]
MTVHYPIVFETEASGAVSAYVPGLPVYVAADSHAQAERAIRVLLTAYLEAHPGSRSDAQVRVARVSDRRDANDVDLRRLPMRLVEEDARASGRVRGLGDRCVEVRIGDPLRWNDDREGRHSRGGQACGIARIHGQV